MKMRKIRFKVVLIALLAVFIMLPACGPNPPAPYPTPGQISGDQVTNRMFPDRTNLTYPQDTNSLMTDDRASGVTKPACACLRATHRQAPRAGKKEK